jgi:glycosyltransferase involved in cell wall biosynthesis
MKFSVLLPTRNRLEYLKYAIASVTQQDYDHWEVVVSDNNSEDDNEGYIKSLSDSRIKYFRTQSFISVTENWNHALEKSSGDYLIMLGDDDCLLKNYFKACLNLLQQNDFPDMIYTSALNYVYPNVLTGSPQGCLMKFGYASFLVDKRNPYILDKQAILNHVREVMNFTLSVNFNMQHSLVSRSLVKEMHNYGKFYQSPYPDYYATTSLLIKAKRILAVPYPMVVIGVTPKSFGCYYSNDKEDQGMEFLQNTVDNKIHSEVQKYILSGTNMNVSWLLAMDTVKQNFGKECPLRVNYRKFRFLQTLHQCKKFACHEGVRFRDMIAFVRNLFWWEALVFPIPFFIALFIRLLPKNTLAKGWANKMAYAFSHPCHGTPKQLPGQYNNIMDVFHSFEIRTTCLIEKPEV